MKKSNQEPGKRRTHLSETQLLSQMKMTQDESESSYRSIFEHATDSIYIQDRNGVFIDVNPAATKMYGYTREEMVGYTPDKLAAPGRNDMDKTKEHLLKAFNGESQRFEWWGLRKNGEEFPKEIILNRGMYFGKEVVFAMARDITERSLVLEALKENEDKYQSLTDQIPVGVYRTTTDGHLIYSNPALVKILNYDSVDELLQLNVSQLYANPSDRERQLTASKKNSGIIQSIFQLKKKSGELIWVKDNSRLVFDKNGNPSYFDGILEDITESKRVENAIKESEANLKSIIENTMESIWSINRNYEIQYINEVFARNYYRTFGVQLKKGIKSFETLPVNLRQTWKERYDRALNNKHFIFEDKIDTGDTSVYIEVAMNPIAKKEKAETEIITVLKETPSFKSTILIAEDDYASYLYLENLLNSKGITFLHTTYGADTVKIVRENPDISLIIMDLRMPGLTGLEATEQIRQFNKSIPIIAQTAYALAGDREIAINAGCNDYISKPINRAELKRMVYQYTGKKSDD